MFSGVKQYLDYVSNLTFDEEPDYELCRSFLREAIKTKGYKNDGKLVFSAATPTTSKKSKSKLRGQRVSKRKSDQLNEEVEDEEPVEEVTPKSSKRQRSSKNKAKASTSAGSGKENSKNSANTKKKAPESLKPMTDSTGLSNPTPQMLALMASKGKTLPQT